MIDQAYLQRLNRVQPYAELWRDDKAFIEHRVGLYATLYFTHVDPSVHDNHEVREALIECWNDYWEVVGPEHQKWIYRFRSGGSVPSFRLPTDKVSPIDQFLRNPENFLSYQYYVHSGKHDDDASEYLFSLAAFSVNGAPEHPSRLGYLRLQVPLSYVTDGRISSFVELTKRCAARLKVDQAHGGLGFLRTYNEEGTTRRTEYQLSQVFSGVDVDIPHRQQNYLFHWEQGLLGIDSPHWMNFLADHWVGKLGGIDALRAQLPAETFVVEPYDGGVYIQAGPYPEPGHKEDGLPPAYVWLNRVLMPVRAPEMVYHTGDEPGELARYQGAKPYFTRFDAASDKLGASLVAGLEASSTLGVDGRLDQSMRLRCEAGQPCPKTGFWFTPARAGSRQRFEVGQVMPEVGGDYGATIWQWDDQQG